MAKHLLNCTTLFQKLVINSRSCVSSPLLKWQEPMMNNNRIIFANSTRNTNFFNKLPADDLWKGITTVSNAGKKRGRGKRVSKRNIKDLNRGQMIGIGKANIQWPGLSAPIIRGKELVEQIKLPEDPEREQKLIQLRDTMGTIKYAKLNPLERGWSGTKMPGRSLGPPDPIGEDNFNGFDTRALELKIVVVMKGNFGRKRRMSALVVTGNKNGLAGFAMGKALDPRIALRKAKNRSGQKLMHIKLFNNHTVCHHFFTQFGYTKIYVWQKPEGYGLRCHRAIKTICEVIGIKDIHCKIEGSTNVNYVTKAFFLGLIRQKSPKEIAEEKGLHLVQICAENNYFPKVIASPQECRKQEEIGKTETLDFNQYCFDGMTPSAARIYHEMKIIEYEDPQELPNVSTAHLLANSRENPTERQIKYLYDKWRLSQYGSRKEKSMIDVLKNKQFDLEKSGGKLVIKENPFVAAVVTPIMRRAFLQGHCNEMVFVDSSGSCDQTNTSVTFLFTSNKTGAIPVACVLHKAQTEANYTLAFLSAIEVIESGRK